MTTRDKLLIMLTEGGEGPLSGEEMSRSLGISRAGGLETDPRPGG